MDDVLLDGPSVHVAHELKLVQVARLQPQTTSVLCSQVFDFIYGTDLWHYLLRGTCQSLQILVLHTESDWLRIQILLGPVLRLGPVARYNG